MSQLTDSEIIAALHQAVPEPPHSPDRLAVVRRKARHRRQLQLSAVSVAAVAVVAVGTTAVSGWPGAHSTHQQQATLTPARTLADLYQRPVHLPTVAAGLPCPVSTVHTFPEGGGFVGPYLAVGSGPFTLTGDGTVPVNFSTPDNDAYAGSGWPGMKVIWRLSNQYAGPVLLRGGRIDRPGELRFDHYMGAVGENGDWQNGTAHPDLAYDTSGSTPMLTTYPSGVRVKAPGCYAVQVDGTSFSNTIVFKVVTSGS